MLMGVEAFTCPSEILNCSTISVLLSLQLMQVALILGCLISSAVVTTVAYGESMWGCLVVYLIQDPR